MRIVVATDKFKGTLTGPEAADAMAAGAVAAIPSADVVVVPSADGGEGTLAAMLAGEKGESHATVVRDPLGRRVTAPYGRLRDGRVIVEVAAACGLDLLDEPAPTEASSIGVGDLIRLALAGDVPVTEIVVGVGGTASTDGGTGAARAVGWRFLDGGGAELPLGGAALTRLHAIDGSAVEKGVGELAITAACDVSNPLTGPMGSARAFGPQKGASPSQIEILERGLERLGQIVARDLDVDLAGLPRGGAGGGLGAGLAAFFGAELVSGFDLVASATGLATEIQRGDVVVTGEGRLDESTGGGKVVSGVIRLAHASGVRCIVIAGEIDRRADLVRMAEGANLVSLVERYGADANTDAAGCIGRVVAEVLSG